MYVVLALIYSEDKFEEICCSLIISDSNVCDSAHMLKSAVSGKKYANINSLV